MSFPNRLREARKRAGLTQQALADALGITKNSVSNYEKGTSFPKPDILFGIFDVLGVEPQQLLSDSEDT